MPAVEHVAAEHDSRAAPVLFAADLHLDPARPAPMQRFLDFLTAEAIRYEKESAKWVRAQVEWEQNILKENGMEVLTLKGDAAQRYRELAHDIAWKRLEQRSPEHAAQLKKLMYDPAKF